MVRTEKEKEQFALNFVLENEIYRGVATVLWIWPLWVACILLRDQPTHALWETGLVHEALGPSH